MNAKPQGSAFLALLAQRLIYQAMPPHPRQAMKPARHNAHAKMAAHPGGIRPCMTGMEM